jgi:excisionase family DNA binding protein
MPATARAHVFDERMPSTAEIENANQLRQILASQLRNDDEPARLKLVVDTDKRMDIVLAPALARTFMELLRHVGSGRSVTIVPTDEQLTTQRAADILNVSRPYLIKLIEREEIPCTKLGRHRRIRAQDVFDYKKRRDSAREEALARLAEVDADLL